MSPSLPPLPALDDEVAMQKYFVAANANWLVPGVVMVGSNPNRAAEGAEKYLEKLAAVGKITTYVCLQSEVPPQSKDAEALGGLVSGDQSDAMPSYANAVVTVDPASEPKFVHYGTNDDEIIASMEELSTLILNLGKRIEAGEVLYIHCKGGTGRTGTVAACVLGKLYPELSSDEVLERVQKYCDVRLSGQGKWVNPAVRSPATDGQKEQVKEFLAIGATEAEASPASEQGGCSLM